MSKNHFAVLGLKPGATEDEIKKSFRSLAKQWHPDKNKNAGAEEKFKEISAAYDFLQSKDRREILQRDLNREKEPKKTESYTYSTFKSTYTETPKPKSKPTPDKKENKDPGKTKKDDHWTSSFFGKNKQKRKPEQKEWSKDWEETPGYKEERKSKFERRPPTFSDAFRSFVDHLDSEFDTFFEFESDFKDPLFNKVDPFAELYAQGAVSTVYRPKKKKPPARPRHVAPERGKVEGLDEEYLFSPRLGGQSREFQYASEESDLSSDGEFGYDADKAAAKTPCHYCGKLFQAYKLAHHEQNCGKFDHDSDGEQNFFPPGSRRKSTGDWRQTSNQLHSEIRRAKEAAGAKAAEEKYATVFCKWCGQSFSKSTAERHIALCERSANRGAGSGRTEKAKEYAKNVPKPGAYKTQGPMPSKTFQSDSSEGDDAPSTSYSTSTRRSQPTPKSFAKSSSHPKTPQTSHTTQKTHTQNTTHKTQTSHATQKPHTQHASFTRQPYASQTKQSKTQTHPKAAGSRTPNFGVSGESVKKKYGDHGTGGCASCKKTFGAGAKFACSCGTKTSFR